MIELTEKPVSLRKNVIVFLSIAIITIYGATAARYLSHSYRSRFNLQTL